MRASGEWRVESGKLIKVRIENKQWRIKNVIREAKSARSVLALFYSAFAIWLPRDFKLGKLREEFFTIKKS
jgi:hypothetical protein